MREIKFRVWDKYWKEMIYDIQDTFEENYTLGIDYFGQYLNNDDFEVMQYTGLKDINGKEIYESDIIKLNGCRYGYGKIIYFDGGYKIRLGNSQWDLNKSVILGHHVITKGNIYENSELLSK